MNETLSFNQSWTTFHYYSKYSCLINIPMLGLDRTLHNESKVLWKIKWKLSLKNAKIIQKDCIVLITFKRVYGINFLVLLIQSPSCLASSDYYHHPRKGFELKFQFPLAIFSSILARVISIFLFETQVSIRLNSFNGNCASNWLNIFLQYEHIIEFFEFVGTSFLFCTIQVLVL